MYVKHLTVVPGGSKRIAETPAWNLGLDPCPYCGGMEFLQHTREKKLVRLEDDGTCHTKPHDSDLTGIWCRECDTRLA